jgi:hypothetical protein
MTFKTILATAAAALVLSSSTLADACACGCGGFGVGAGNLIQLAGGGTVYVETDYLNQDRNFSGDSRAPAANNDDKQIQTEFVTVGGQYSLSADWRVAAEVPIENRVFRTADDDGGVDRFEHAAIGDVRLTATYSGLARDHTTGVTFGVKLPTGDFKYPGFDRDTEIGTGSTDLLLGVYHLGDLNKARTWTYFAQARAQVTLASQGGYTPGNEVDGAIGVSYGGLGAATDKVKFTPLLQLEGSVRAVDSGPATADSQGSGYQRLVVAPGIEMAVGRWKFYGDLGFPVYQHVNGNQLTAPVLFKAVVSRSF